MFDKVIEQIEKAKEIKNLTPHPITVQVDEARYTFQPADQPIRLNVVIKQVTAYGQEKIQVITKEFSKPNYIPEEKEGVLYLVSLPVAQYMRQKFPDRSDILTIGNYIRDKNGAIVGCTNLAVVM